MLSMETIVANHPWVDDPEAEMERIRQEKAQDMGTDFDHLGGDGNGSETQ